MELLQTARPALTGLERRLFELTTVAIALTRIWARSRTLWDWDETLFSIGVRSYDVVQHHPHPPGFPLYIALAKSVRLFLHSDFHALQMITTIAAIALFPLVTWLALELRFPFRTAYLGALLFVFFPNVWFFGGTAFSDIPGLALLIAACAVLLRSCSAPRAYFAGALLLGLAAAIRPQALMVGCAPALIASWYRPRPRRVRDVVVASAIGIAVLAISYGGAALASQSIHGYIAINRSLREYVRTVDSFLNPGRQPLLTLISAFFLHPIPDEELSTIVSILALASIVTSFVRRSPSVWILVAMFLPFNIFGWFMLDTNSISRYSIGFAVMYAILAVDALDFIVDRLPIVQIAIVLFLAAKFAKWALPAIRDVRSTPSPTVASMQWIRAKVPRVRTVYVHGSMGPFATYFLTGFDAPAIEDPGEVPVHAVNADEWFVTEGSSGAIDGLNFVRERGRLFDIVRQRYFEVSVRPFTEAWRFGDGWYGEESVGNSAWRWMSGRSVTLLPPLAGKGKLTIMFDVPTAVVSRHTTMTVSLNGQQIDQFLLSTTTISKTWIVPARSDAWNELVLSLDHVVNPAKEHIGGDARDLGLNLTSYGWIAAP